ncbi:hypothetical protein DFQ28_006878 [Apophysomyces sp. BC1034]|nr:hypothetical protein DFQ30_000015 [Apophysomyces sp. BC1015]KAG0181989.1 hypothetical protein DFQ29_006248 [Apophysomyces sp. BC1021]KAG0192994.1 hypothetical protein DFQ28_006878 [Apophysomyces sp. BC1034]
MVEQLSDQTLIVRSFTQKDVSYEISVDGNAMTSCSCRDFRWSQSACKHMYLLHRDNPVIQVFVPSLPEQKNPTPTPTPIEPAIIVLICRDVEEQLRQKFSSLTPQQQHMAYEKLKEIQDCLLK